jgi:hypothetical protein
MISSTRNLTALAASDEGLKPSDRIKLCTGRRENRAAASNGWVFDFRGQIRMNFLACCLVRGRVRAPCTRLLPPELRKSSNLKALHKDFSVHRRCIL